MPKHEFGIMKMNPKRGRRYDRYEPEKHNCITVADEQIRPLMGGLAEIKCYWHTLDRAELGLAYNGVTLIPPESLEPFGKVIGNDQNLSELSSLLSQAQEENKYVIHFGV